MICGPYGGKKKILERTTVVLLRVLRQPEFKLRLLFSIEKRLHFFIKETVRAYPYIQTECNNIYTMRKLLYHTRVTALPTLKCRAEAEIEMHDVDVWKSECIHTYLIILPTILEHQFGFKALVCTISLDCCVSEQL